MKAFPELGAALLFPSLVLAVILTLLTMSALRNVLRRHRGWIDRTQERLPTGGVLRRLFERAVLRWHLDQPAPSRGAGVLDHAVLGVEGFLSSRSSRGEVVLVFGGLLLLLLGQMMGGDFQSMTWLPSAFSLMGVISFLVGARRVEKSPGLDRGWPRLAPLASWLGVREGQVFLLALSVLLAIGATGAAGPGPKMVSPAAALISWLIAVPLVILGGWRRTNGEGRSGRAFLKVPLLLFLLALLIRGIDTTHNPTIVHGDEASFGLSAVTFVKGDADNPFTVAWFSFPSLFAILQSLSISLLGQTIAALRIPSAIAGALTVVALYFVVRSMFDRETALLSGLFLVGLHFHVNFSRIGTNNIWDGLFFPLTLGALWIGWQRGHRAAFLLAGLSLGLSQYFYTSSRLLFPIALLWLLLASLSNRASARANLPNLLAMGLVTAVVLMPLGWFFIRHPNEFMAPMERVTVLGRWLTEETSRTGLSAWQVLLNQMKLSSLAYTQIPVTYWYQPDVPILRAIPSLFFLVGAALLLTRWRDSRTWMALLWWFAITAAGALSESTPAAQRYVAAAPLCALVVGYGISSVGRVIARIWPQRSRLAASLALCVAVLLTLDDLRFFFLEYTPTSNRYNTVGQVALELARYLQGKTSEWQVVFMGSPIMGYYSISTIPYLAPHIEGLDAEDPWGSPDNPQPTSDHLIFVFLPGHEADLEAVQREYPGGMVRETENKFGETLYRYYEYVRPGA